MPEPVNAPARRPYNSPARTEQARQTRRRVLDAAQDLFLADGYPRTTIAAVAARAGVAADTVLHLFSSKRGLLKEVLDVAVGGDDEDVPFLERPGPRALAAETDQRRQVAMFAAGMTGQLERVRPVDDILRTAAAVDPQIAALRDDVQLRQRRAAMSAVTAQIAANGPLRGGRDVEHAAAAVWTLTSPEVHHHLRVSCGWSPEEYREWLREQLEAVLLPTDPPAAR